jgi:hypothetical protein
VPHTPNAQPSDGETQSTATMPEFD